jgi:primase-polymerase (primpol)-like protein
MNPATSTQILAVRPDSIPAELCVLPQWVLWRLGERDGRYTKIPYTPGSDRRASSTDPTTWGVFEDALEKLASPEGAYDGVGFVFSSGDPYVGVDLDDCVDPETGEIAVWATQIIDGLDSYTELSPSGTGVHIIAKGKFAECGRRGPIEMYSRDRYFTVTGHVLGESL